MPRILFVDDEVRILEGLARMLYSLRREWDMKFAKNGPAALLSLQKEPFDVLVTDMRMPEMDGGELLRKVQQLYPNVIRIVLSGQSSRDSVMRTIGPAHQFLAKPCEADSLKETISRAFALRTILADDSLTGLVTHIQNLPSLPNLYLEVMQELRSPEASVAKVATVITKDLGMTTKILQLVNSAFFGMSRNVADPKQAVGLLGLETVGTLVLSTGIFSQFEDTEWKDFKLERLWNHSMTVGNLARSIAVAEKLSSQQSEEAFLAGMLHDVGILVLAANKPKEFQQVLALAPLRRITLWEAEREIFGSTHAEVGAYLLGLWGFTNPIVEALAFHHSLNVCPGSAFSCLTAVHVADALAYEGKPADEGVVPPQIDMEKLEEMQLVDHLPLWRKACLAQDLKEGRQ